MDHKVELKFPKSVFTSSALVDHFQSMLHGVQDVTVVVPLPSIGNANSPLDIVQDLLETSFVAEALGECAQRRSFKWRRPTHIQQLHLSLSQFQTEALCNELARMTLLLDFSEVEGDSDLENLRDEYESILEELFDHEEGVATRQLIFPDLADLYFINLVRGAYYEWEPDVVAGDIKRWPERRYGFIASRLASTGGTVLCSGDEWIIPDSVGLQGFVDRSGLEPDALLPGAVVLAADTAIFVGAHASVTVTAGTVLNALACGDDFARRNEPDLDVYDLLRFRGIQAGRIEEGQAPRAQALIGEFATRAVLKCDGYSIVFMNVTELHSGERMRYAEQLALLEVPLRDGEPMTGNISVAWAQLDDEMFEQLCFDYLFARPDFDRHRLEKIGKSRSRDGGRDIVAWTIGDKVKFEEPRKYIFQCKHIPPNTSLTATRHFQAIGDTLEQYGSNGYGVMCSGYIDATLHDRVEAIQKSRNLAPSYKIDRLHLERFLARRPHLVKRYFGPLT